jgi:hypothetical protein
MKKLIVLAAACAIALMIGISGCSKESCLKKYGYDNCDHLRKALNLKDSDEAQKFHDICKKCGCGDCGDKQ